jgi:His-Xaa-Ser system radical SAM maturase HxsC
MIDLSTYGRPLNLTRPVVGRICREEVKDSADRSECVVLRQTASTANANGYRALLTTGTVDVRNLPEGLPCVHSARQLSHLRSGDVVALYPRTGYVRTLFRPDSQYNALLLTERCNSYCLMCSQPPIERDDSELVEINIETIRLMKPPPVSLGLTGGEPTLLGAELFRIFKELGSKMPDTVIDMLTNGRRFAWPHFTEAFAEARHPRLTVCIPLYADNGPEHDYVVQSRGAFDQTVQGLYQLARYEQPVEIRVVLHKLTVPRLRELALFVYRNLPFVGHVALMGLEITGFARPNLEKLWIDPFDYQHELQEAVEILAVRGMNVSIYNHPLCLLPRQLWKFARKSISDWKNVFFDECRSCAVREECGGLFKSAVHRHSVHIRAL